MPLGIPYLGNGELRLRVERGSLKDLIRTRVDQYVSQPPTVIPQTTLAFSPLVIPSVNWEI